MAEAAQLRAELAQLQQALAAREREVGALKEIAEAASNLQSADTQAAKVIELSKKNRSLNLLLERERQRVAQLQQALSEATAPAASLATSLGALRAGSPNSGGASGATGTGGGGTAAAARANAAARSAVEAAAEAAEAAAREAGVWRERAQGLTNKLAQAEQKLVVLEGENRKLTRALVREVGEDVPLAKVLEEGSDWKGRRETIIALKDTIRKLREEKGAATPTRHDEAHRNTIGRLAKERAAETERLQGELAAARAAAEAARRQYAGASSRRKVVEDEMAALKDKMAVLLRKTQNDDKLIAALRCELAAAAHAGARHIHGSVLGSDSAPAAEVWAEVVQLRQQVAEQDEQLEQSAKVIRYLQGQLHGLQSAAGSGAGSPLAPSAAGGAPQPAPAAAAGQQGAKEALLLEQLEATQDECSELRAQVQALADDLQQLRSRRPGTSAMNGELRAQLLALQEEVDRLRGAGQAAAGAPGALQHQRSAAGRSAASGGLASKRSTADVLVVEAPAAAASAAAKQPSMARRRSQQAAVTPQRSLRAASSALASEQVVDGVEEEAAAYAQAEEGVAGDDMGDQRPWEAEVEEEALA